MSDIENLFGREILFAEGLPIGNWIRSFHLYKDKFIWNYPVSFDRDEIRVLEAFKVLNHLKCTTALFLIQSRDVDARNHFVYSCFWIACNKNFSIALPEVKRNNHIRVMPRVRRVATSSGLLNHRIIWVLALSLNILFICCFQSSGIELGMHLIKRRIKWKHRRLTGKV